MGIREQLRSLRRQMNEGMDFVVLKDGTRHYFDPEKDTVELWLEMMSKTYRITSEVETPELRKALAQATEESVARFEERYHPVTWEVRIVRFPDEDQVVVRRIELDGTVRTFLLEGEAAKEHRTVAGAQTRAEPIDPNREGVREIDPEEVSKVIKVKDLSR